MANEESSSKESAPATSLPLFYSKPAPIDSKIHAKMGLLKNFGLGFTRNVNSVPINMIEMSHICHSYPIAFSPSESAQPVALLGLRDNENLFLNEADEWEPDTYVPAYIRRYPFIFSEISGSDQLTLCVDFVENIIKEGGEQSLFDEKGEPTELTTNAIEFCKSYHAAAQQTIEFSKALSEAGLLVDRRVEITANNGSKFNFSGFRVVDEKKLNEMDGEAFLKWRQKGWLPFLYAHLFSGTRWAQLTARLNKRLAATSFFDAKAN